MYKSIQSKQAKALGSLQTLKQLDQISVKAARSLFVACRMQRLLAVVLRLVLGQRAAILIWLPLARRRTPSSNRTSITKKGSSVPFFNPFLFFKSWGWIEAKVSAGRVVQNLKCGKCTMDRLFPSRSF